MKAEPATLYLMDVMHARLQPFHHAFRYKAFSILIDIDRVAEAAKKSWVFSHNGFGLLGFSEKSHGARDGSPLRPWVEKVTREIGVDLEGGRIRLLCFPKVLGYEFNPLAIYYCEGPDGALRAIVYQVHNTFGEAHAYVVPVPEGTSGIIRQKADKVFHVSPFMDLDSAYTFSLREPGERARIAIRQTRQDEPLLIATMTGNARPWRSGALLKAFLSVPLMTFNVVFGIHWQALRLWIKGARYHSNPKNRSTDVTPGEALEVLPTRGSHNLPAD